MLSITLSDSEELAARMVAAALLPQPAPPQPE